MSDRIALILLACALALMVAVIVGTGAGYLARRDYATYPTALVRAVVAFAATLNLAATLTTALVALGR